MQSALLGCFPYFPPHNPLRINVQFTDLTSMCKVWGDGWEGEREREKEQQIGLALFSIKILTIASIKYPRKGKTERIFQTQESK